ncbi:hypothetical protein P7H06_15325 [Paenibacillus larvae]|nr:hypothetical protein [Paenibacillus larvae]MDT2260597.1 hypothetical protein [Paenibacillus larvae]
MKQMKICFRCGRLGDEYPPSRVWGDEIYVGDPGGLPEASEK